MKSNGRDDTSEVIFLTGAGFSVSIGIPAMRGIYRAFLKKAKSGITPNEKKTCRFFTEELGVEEDLEEFLLAANAIAEFNSSCMASFVEEAMSGQRRGLRIRNYRTSLSQNTAKVVAIRSRILNFMSKTCFEFSREKACDTFGGLVKAVSEKGYPIYTTNYDFALEHVAQESYIEVQDNFVQRGQRHLWNPDIHFPLGNALTLVKLHGSVAWYADEDGIIEKLYASANINPAGKHIDRLVIFPTRFKDIYAQHFFALYSHFLSALSAARVLIVIGHSLRDDYLRAGIIERHRKGGFQLVVVDPVFPKELPQELKPARLGNAGAVTHIPFKFEEFADEIAHIALNSVPLHLARDCAAIVRQRKSRTNKIAIKGNIGVLHVGDKKAFKARVDAYVLPHERPAHVRVWLSARFTAPDTPDGQQEERVGGQFIDGGGARVATGLTGMVQQEEIPLEVKVPEYSDWAKHAAKVTLHVALLRETAKKPAQAKGNAILAVAERELTYVC